MTESCSADSTFSLSAKSWRLEDIVTTEELATRPSRPPKHEVENRALVMLAGEMAQRPDTLFQKLVEAAIELTGAESAGVSLLDPDGSKFRWLATAGTYQPFLGATLPRDFSPCGTVLDRNAPQLMADPARFWPYIDDLKERIAEVLLVPFYRGDRPIGTVWVVAHKGLRPFDAEDARLVASLSRFASAAIHVQNNLLAAEAANRDKDRHLAFLAHELRGPLTPALLAAAAMAADDRLPASVRTDADLIRRNIELTARLADDLLDANRIAHGKLELRVEPTDAHETIKSAVTMCAAEAEAKEIKVELDLRADRHVVGGDAAKLTQVWCNLLKNAVKFSPNGRTVHVRTDDGDDGRLKVEFCDAGEGVDASLLPRMFNLYEQGDRTVTRQHAGLGLGLAICKGIVEAHRGTITAASDGRGCGTTMWVDLPADSTSTAVTGKAPRNPVPEVGAAPLHILLVDDHDDTLRLMSRMLRQSNHAVTTATGVGTALSAAEGAEFDLLISDLGLDDGSGMDLMRELLKRGPVKGIALTGYGTAADVAATREAGFAAHLTKPINFDELEAMISAVAS